MASTIAFLTSTGQQKMADIDAVLERLLTPAVPGRPWYREEPAARHERCAAIAPYAADPAATPDLLRRIVETLLFRNFPPPATGEAELYAALAGNPNTPPDVLATCALYSPAAFCANPVAPLLVLEAPDFARQLCRWGLSRLLRRPDVPISLLASLSTLDVTHGLDWPGEARQHIGLAGEVPASDWQTAVSTFWQEYASAGPGREEMRIVQDLAALGLAILPESLEPDRALRERLACACDPETDPDWLTKTARSGQERWVVRLAAVLNPSLPVAIRDRTRRAFGRWDHVRQELDRFFGGNGDPSTAADRPSTAQAIQATVREMARRRYLMRFADREPLLQLFLLLGLSGNGAASLRTPTKRQMSATESEDWRVRLGAALTLPAIPTSRKGRTALSRLAEDGNRLVRAAARARLHDPSLVLIF